MEIKLELSLMSCNNTRSSGLEVLDRLRKSSQGILNYFKSVPAQAYTVKYDGDTIGYISNDPNQKTAGLFTMDGNRVATIKGNVQLFPEKWKRFEILKAENPKIEIGSLLVETVPYPRDSQITRMQLDLNKCD